MPATLQVSMSYPKPRSSQEKFIRIARTDTTAFQAAMLPKDAIITGIYVIGSAASNAGTSATISVGTSVTANELLNAFDVKTASSGQGYVPAGAAAVGSALATPLANDTLIYARYAETGTASSSGGPWTVKIEYAQVGGGETAQM